jgi:DNA-3-methyladenine glycosylase
LSSGNYQKSPRFGREFYSRDVLIVAPELIGKSLVRNDAAALQYYTITETEAYRGVEDQASHARFGRTSRNSIMYGPGGLVYVYLVYGMHWMLNIVTGAEGNPQAILIRGLKTIPGPALLTRALGIDKSFYGEDLVTSGRIWVEDSADNPVIIQKPRVGINYAGEPWKSNLWRYMDAQSR